MVNTKGVVASAVLAGLSLTTSAWAAKPSHLEHKHSAGTWMAEYSYMRMGMDGLLNGTDDYSSTSALSMMDGNYMMAPTEMTMDMHMIMPMFNITSELSVMVMLNYVDNTMEMVNGAGATTTMTTSGLGDTVVNASYKFKEDMFAASLDLSVPTGSIDEQVTMMNMEQQAPYAMQLGSGTYDLTPSLTYLDGMYTWRWGGQVSYTYRMGENDNGYTLGNRAKALAWVRKPVGRFVLSGEASFLRWGDIEGSDPDIRTSMTMGMMTMNTSPTAFSSNYGGSRADVAVGAETFVGPATVGLALGMPVYQDLNGVQMKSELFTTVSLSAMF